jgi:hypothetical protein
LRLEWVERLRLTHDLAQPFRRRWLIVDGQGVRWLED